LGRAMRAGIEALGLRLTTSHPADAMTAAYFPDGLDGRVFLNRLEKRFGIKLAGGQGPLKGRIFRIAHFGLIDELDVLSTLAALEQALVEYRQDVKLGNSVAAAGQVLAEADFGN
jgi:serine---pyruvate transaminase